MVNLMRYYEICEQSHGRLNINKTGHLQPIAANAHIPPIVLLLSVIQDCDALRGTIFQK